MKTGNDCSRKISESSIYKGDRCNWGSLIGHAWLCVIMAFTGM